MLRHPGESSANQLGEGCSSTATGKFFANSIPVWNNLADRGSGIEFAKNFPAVP